MSLRYPNLPPDAELVEIYRKCRPPKRERLAKQYRMSASAIVNAVRSACAQVGISYPPGVPEAIDFKALLEKSATMTLAELGRHYRRHPDTIRKTITRARRAFKIEEPYVPVRVQPTHRPAGVRVGGPRESKSDPISDAEWCRRIRESEKLLPIWVPRGASC